MHNVNDDASSIMPMQNTRNFLIINIFADTVCWLPYQSAKAPFHILYNNMSLDSIMINVILWARCRDFVEYRVPLSWDRKGRGG